MAALNVSELAKWSRPEGACTCTRRRVWRPFFFSGLLEVARKIRVA